MSFGGEPKIDKEKTPESIKSAATRYKDEIFTGQLHIDSVEAFESAHPELLEKSHEALGLAHGFMTNTGRFVSKQEALEIAHRSNQLKEGVIQHRSRLLSDDLKQNSDESNE